jgi:release factor glutamine methyltransferase
MPLFEVHDWPRSNAFDDARKWGREALAREQDQRSAQQLVDLILESLLSAPIFKLKMNQVRLTEPELIRFKHQLNRLDAGEALQYITGKAHFLHLELHVAPGVLIPRPETEELLVLFEKSLPQNAKVIDLATGSACIALALADRNRGMTVQAMDLSEDALTIAEKNKTDLGLELEFFHGDLLSPDFHLDDQYDGIVSNPPYIPEREKSSMADHVVKQEPEMALFVPNDHVLIFYEAIARISRKSLKHHGVLCVEIHEDYAEEVKGTFIAHGLSEVEIHKDLQGKDRMISALNRN